MKRKTYVKNQRGFTQILLLVAIITSVLAVSVIVTGTVLYKQGKLSSVVASVLGNFKDSDKKSLELNNVQNLEHEATLEENLISGEDVIFQTEQKLKEAELEKQKVEEEAERLRVGKEEAEAEAERIKAEQEEIKRLTEEKIAKEEALIKVEKCKSEYTANKGKMITEFDNYEFPLKEVGVKMAFQTSLDNCVDECLNLLKENLGSYYPPSALSLCNYCKQTYSAMVSKTLEAIKSSKYNDIEQQFQLEYQQCLEE